MNHGFDGLAGAKTTTLWRSWGACNETIAVPNIRANGVALAR